MVAVIGGLLRTLRLFNKSEAGEPVLSLDNLGAHARIIICHRGSSSVVERDLAKVEVASSTLVSRSSSLNIEGGGMKDESKILLFIPHPSALILFLAAA